MSTRIHPLKISTRIPSFGKKVSTRIHFPLEFSIPLFLLLSLEYPGLLRIISPLDCGALTRMTSKHRTSRNLKPQVFPFPNTLLMLLCLEKKDFLLITFLQLLWGYYDGLCTPTVHQPLCSLEIEKLLQPTFQMAPPRPTRYFFSIMPYINFAYVHR